MRTPLTLFIPHCSDLLTDHLPHGDGLIAHSFITNLARRGHTLHVAAEKVSLRQPLPRNVTVYEIPLASSGRFSRRIEYMLRVRSLLWKLKKYIDFDLTHQLNPVFTGISLLQIGSDLPLVLGAYFPGWPVDSDTIPSNNWKGRVLATTRNVVSTAQQSQADALLLTTPAASQRISNSKSLNDRIYYLPIGIDIEVFSPANEPNSLEKSLAKKLPPSILFLANVLERKGIFTLIAAFPAVAHEIPTAKLAIAGDGPDLEEAQRRVASLGCSKQVEFLGRQERVDAPALYRNCSVYCLPS